MTAVLRTWVESAGELCKFSGRVLRQVYGLRVFRFFGETLRGLKTTFARLIEGPMVYQYPEEKVPVYPRFRGRHKLHRFEDSGLE